MWVLVCDEVGERDSEQWEQNQDVLFKLIAGVVRGKVCCGMQQVEPYTVEARCLSE